VHRCQPLIALGLTASSVGVVLNHGFNRSYLPNTLTPSYQIHTQRLSTGTWLANGAHANGTAVQDFTYSDAKLNTYERHVEARNSTIISDKEGGTINWNWPSAWSRLTEGGSDAQNDYVARLPTLRN
jgi:hypothetical protein